MSPNAPRPSRAFDWVLWRAPVTAVAIVVLLGLGAAVLRGQWQLSKTTIEETDAQDFGIFYASVRNAVAGKGLYAPLPPRRLPPYYTGQLNLNLPHTNLFFLPLAFLSPRQSLVVWAIASLLVFAWSTWASLRALHWRVPLVGWIALVVYLLAWGPAAAFSLTLQLSFLLMGPVTASWLAARDGRPVAAGAWLGLAASAKPFLLLVVAYLALRRDARALRAFAVVSLLFVLAGLLVFGPQSYVDWATQLPRVSWASHYMNASLGGMVERLFGHTYYGTIGGAGWVRLTLLPILSIAIAALTLRAAVRPRRSASGEDHALGGAAARLDPAVAAWVGLLPLDRALARGSHHRPPAAVAGTVCQGLVARAGTVWLALVPAHGCLGPAVAAGDRRLRLDVFLGAAVPLVVVPGDACP